MRNALLIAATIIAVWLAAFAYVTVGTTTQPTHGRPVVTHTEPHSMHCPLGTDPGHGRCVAS